MLEIKNLTSREIIFEFFFPHHELSGLQMTPVYMHMIIITQDGVTDIP